MFTGKTKIALVKGIVSKRTPIYVQFAVTKNCNLRCSMCASSVSRETEHDLGLEEINVIAENLSQIGVGIVVLTGGEPFLRKDLAEIVRAFTSRGLTARLQTNGLLADEERIREIYRAGINEITISLDTLSPEKEDIITNKSGSWTGIIKAISRFSMILPSKGALLGINTIVSKNNLEDVLEVIKFSTKIGFWCSLIPVHVASEDGADFIIRQKALEFAFGPEDFGRVDSVYAQIIDMKKRGYNVYNSYKFLKNSPRFLKGERVRWHCDSPNLYFAISPSGSFLPCVDLKTDISVLGKDFPGIYRSTEFQKQILSMVRTCQGCYYACWPEVSYLCRDAYVLAERILLGVKTIFRKRLPVNYGQCLEIIADIKKNKSLHV